MHAPDGRNRSMVLRAASVAVAAGAVLTGYAAVPGAAAPAPATLITGGDAGSGTSADDVSCGRPPVALERDAQDFVNKLAAENSPPLSELGPVKAREVLNNLQAGPVEKLPVDITEKTIKGGPTGEVSLRIVKPKGAKGTLPGLVYVHGGGWVLGNAQTHDRLVRQLATGANAAVVFVNYTPSPEARHPVAIEQAYAASKWVAEHGREIGVDGGRLAIAGDSAGGQMATAVTMMAKAKGGVAFRKQALLYPVNEANFDTPSYQRFAANCWLSTVNMKWFWDEYAPTQADRENPLASPNKATEAQLSDLPPAIVITDSDVLLSGAETYVEKLRAAGVPVEHHHYPRIVHDFMMLDALRNTEAAKDAVEKTTAALRKALHR
ncbi:alpha/beta hydrolase [Streptomyces flaveolus]|uniref:alpha/beta hydrolase n=1 Tax=Streptomyces flaveolus TaxID=67297 RepID=UPI0036F5A6E8